MFKKIKDKLAEEMKQSPARLQASMQQLAQAVSPALSSTSIQDLSASNDNFSLTEETDTETPRNSPAKHGFQSVNLTTSSDDSLGSGRRSSASNAASDTSFLFPLYESPVNTYHLQSDMDQSASEIDDNISPQLDRVTKDQLYLAYRNVQTKHQKYRDKYRELVSHYREIQRNESKLESLLVETQDKALRRIADLKEQCQLEQQAKAHLEELLRNDIDEKECLINSLNTKIALLQKNGDENGEIVENTQMLIDLTNDTTTESQKENLIAENEKLNNKLSMLENIVQKFKVNLKRTKDKLTQETEDKQTLERDYNILQEQLCAANASATKLMEEVDYLKKREEEASISLAENKLSIYRELEGKEEQIKKLTQDLDFSTKTRENLVETLEKYKSEVEQLRSSNRNEYDNVMAKCQEEQHRNDDLARKLEEFEKLLGMEKEKTLRDTDFIEKLNNKLTESNAELIVLKSKNDKLAELYETEKSEKKSLQVVHNELLLSSKEKLAEKDKEIEKMNSELASLTAEHATCKIIVDELKAKIHEIRSQVSQLVEEKETQTKKMLEYRSNAENLREDYQDLQQYVQLNFGERSKNLRDLKEQMSAALLKLSNFKSSNSDEVSKLQTQHEKQTKEHANLKREWEIRTLQVHQLVLLVDDLEIKQQKLLDDNKMLRTTLQSNNMHWLEVEEEFKHNFNLQIENIKTENLQLSAQLSDSTKQISKLKQELKGSLNKAKQGGGKKKNQGDMEETIKKLNSRISELEEENSKFNVENLTLNMLVENKKEKTEEVDDQVKKYTMLEEICKSQSETIETLKSKLECISKNKISHSENSDFGSCESINNLNSKANMHCSKVSKKLEDIKISENKQQLQEKMTIENVDLFIGKKLERLLLDKETAETEIVVLKQKEKELMLRNQELEKDYCKHNETISKLEEKIKELSLGKNETSTIVTELTSANQEIIAENKVLKDKQNELIQKNESLEQSMQQQKQAISELENKFQHLEAKNNGYKNSNIELESLIKCLQSEKKGLENRITESQNINDELVKIENQLEIREKQIGELNMEIQRMNEETLNLQAKIHQLESENLDFNKRLSEQKKLNEELTNENKFLKNEQNEIIKAGEESKYLQSEIISKYQTKIDELIKQMSSCETENMELKNHISKTDGKEGELIKEYEKRETSLQAQINELQKLCEKMSAENEQLQNQNMNSKNEISKFNSHVDKLQLENKQSVERLRELEQIKETIVFENKNLKDEKNILVQKFEEMEFASNIQNKTIVDLSLKHDKLREDYNNLKMELEILKSTNEKISSSNDQLKSDLNASDKENKKLLETILNLETKLQTLTAENESSQILLDQVDKLNENLEKLETEIKDKERELNQQKDDKKNLVKQLEELKSQESNEKSEAAMKNEEEIKSLEQTNSKLEEKLQLTEDLNKQLEAQLDETLVTFQTKESQLKNLNEDLKKKVEELKNELTVNSDEQAMRLKQLAKEFQAQLQDKDEELQAALEKRFDQQKTYESELIRQYKEQLKDFQVELTAKSEQIENLILEKKQNLIDKDEEIKKLTQTIEGMKSSHANELMEIEKKWKKLVEQKTAQLKSNHEQEINELTSEWQHERKTDDKIDQELEELESTSRVAMAAVQSNTGSFHTLQQTLLSQKRELNELRKLVKLRHETLEDSTEIEYLRNILYEYMMGKETLVLAKVIAAVVKFDQDQTSKIIKKEEDKLTLLGSLGLT